MKRIFSLAGAALLSFSLLLAQQTGPEQRIKSFVEFLASDELEGRFTGSEGEQKAAAFISQHFKTLGLKALDNENGLIPFSFTAEITARSAPDPLLAFSGRFFHLSETAFPVTGSGTGQANGVMINLGFGISSPENGHDDYEKVGDCRGKIGLIDVGMPELPHAHHPLAAFSQLVRRIRIAEQKGLAGIIFYRKNYDTEPPSMLISPRVRQASIPVIFVDEDLSSYHGKPCMLDVHLQKKTGHGNNVVFYQDNGAANTIVIGAHYDHVGMGGPYSRYRGESAVHNGADDNASGVAALMWLAEYYTENPPKNFNIIYMAFSGEELGLLGSGAIVEDERLKNFKITAMINMDMVGRLDKQGNGLIINGVGTSPVFKAVTDTLKRHDIPVKTTESGIGPSDHTSFYHKGIPAIHLFTGTHSEYHTPDDDVELLNIQGIVEITDYIRAFISAITSQPEIPFEKTKEPEQARTSSKVSLGVVPDYAYEGKGMKITGVTEGRPAALAGMQGGDLLLAIDDEEISDIYGYMNILSRYKKGQKARIRFEREGQIMEAEIQW